MWSIQAERSSEGRVLRVQLLRHGTAISHAEAVELWRSDEPFRNFFVSVLKDSPIEAYFWETPPLNLATAARPFEFVLVDGPELATPAPEPDAFADRFIPSRPVATFPNLGGDALLVAPAPLGPLDAYAHLAAFSRAAPIEQQHALWQGVGDAATRRLSSAPIWLSTSGLGIAWLHVRLDERPKYYTYAPYRAC